MALRPCRRCGELDPDRMVGLMTLWFGSYVELEPAQGYFYLCPSCYDECVAGHLEEIQGTLARLHPDIDLGPDVEPAQIDEEPAAPDGETSDGTDGEEDADAAAG